VTRAGTALVAAAAFVAAAAVGVVLVTRPSAHERPAAAHGATPAPPDVRVARTHLGRILVDAHGHTLYLFLRDRHGKSTCTGGCARVWPPALVSRPPSAGAGVHPDRLTTTRRADDTEQISYNGHPLYRMSADTKPGQTEGQGFLGTWFVVSPAGRLIGHPRRSGEGY
jgi:predicted lipoprotein with Yx(FWY)xxD motif